MVMWEGNGDGGINTLDLYCILCIFITTKNIGTLSRKIFFFANYSF